MKKSCSRILSLLLTFCMVFGLLPASVFQVYADDPAWSEPTFTYKPGGAVDTVTVDGIVYSLGQRKSVLLNENFEALRISYGDDMENMNNALVIHRRTDAADLTATYTIPVGYNEMADRLDKVYLGAGVVGVASNGTKGLFENQYYLTHVYITSDLASIGARTFYGCRMLNSMDLSHVTSAGAYAFYNCEQFNTINMATAAGATLLSIGNYAFAGCSKVTAVSIGSGQDADHRATIGQYAFDNLDKVLTVTLGSNLTVQSRAFYSNSIMTTLTAGDNIKFSGDYIFYENTKLKDVVLGNNIQLGAGTFRACFDLGGTSGELDLSGVTSIGNICFDSCYKNLTKVTFGSGLTHMGERAFVNCQKLAAINLEDTQIASVPKGAFNHTALTSVSIPASVTSIGDYAFAAYLYSNSYAHSGTIGGQTTTGATPIQKLKTITFAEGSNLASIGAYAFYRQPVTGNLTVPSGVTTIGDYAFYCAGSIGELDLKSTTSIALGYMAFHSGGVTKVNSDAVNTFSCGGYAFYNCPITDLEIAATGTVSIGNNAFYQHRYLKEVELKANTITVGKEAFYIADSCKNTAPYNTLESVSLAGTKVTIGEYAFANNMNLSSLNMLNLTDASKLSLGSRAFGHDTTDAYYTTSETLTVYTDPELSAPQIIDIPSGILIQLGNMSDTGPISKFINGTNYYSGASYSLTLLDSKTVYPTCINTGRYTYQLKINTGSTTGTFFYYTLIPALGHMYSEGVYADADCVHGEYYEQDCVRGKVSSLYGIDSEGYAIDENGQRITADCDEKNHHVISQTGATGALTHEYYAGTLYKRAKIFDSEVAAEEAEYQALTPRQQTNYFDRYAVGADYDDLITRPQYMALEPEEKENYHLIHWGNEYFTESEYAEQSPDGAVAAVYGVALSGTWDPAENGGQGAWKVTAPGHSDRIFTSPFTDYNVVYLEYRCYRNNHPAVSNEQYPYAVAYVPQNLTGKSDQTLADIDLGVTNLAWKDPSQELAGEAGVRYFVAVYTPDGNNEDYFKPVELKVKINVSRVSTSMKNISFTKTVQSTKLSCVPIGVNGVPAGAVAGDPVYKVNNVVKTLDEINTMDAFTGTVEVPVTFRLGVYNLIAKDDDTTPLLWKDDIYNTTGEEALSNLQSGYTGVPSVGSDNDTVTVIISHSFQRKAPALDMIDVVGETTTYDGDGHGFTLLNVPAGSTITVTECDQNHAAVPGEDPDVWTLSAPGEGLNVYTDLRTVTDYESAKINAGVYYFEVKVSNSNSYYSPAEYTTYVSVRIAKKPVNAPAFVYFTYDGCQHTGYEATADYTVTVTDNAGSAVSATDVGTYPVKLTLTNTNYRWTGHTEDNPNLEVSWRIDSLILAVPSISAETIVSGVPTLSYNNHYQTPVDFGEKIRPASYYETHTPQAGDYKYSVNTTEKSSYDIHIYLNGEWKYAYVLLFARKMDSGTVDNMKGYVSAGTNLLFPGNATELSLGGYQIVRAEIEAPALVVPAAEYTGSAYIGTPTVEGSYLWTDDDGEAVFNTAGALTFQYYDSDNHLLPGAPSDVGVYTVKADLTGRLQDPDYTLTNPVVSGTLQISKAALTLEGKAETKSYTGSAQDMTMPVFYNSSNEVVTPELSGQLRYYGVVEVDEKDPETGEPTGNKIYQMNEDDPGTLTAPAPSAVGTYRYYVDIDEACTTYRSSGAVLVELTITEGNQTITVEKKSGSGSVSGTAISGSLCTAPIVVEVYGSLDRTASTTIVYNSSSYSTGTITADAADIKIENAVGGGKKLTIAFKDTTATAFTFTVNCADTENVSGPCSADITVTVGKGTPSVAVSAAKKGADASYTGNSVYNFSTTVTGGKLVALDGTQTNLPITTTGTYNNCTLSFYETEEDALAHTNGSAVEPVNVGTHYVVAMYNGDDNYQTAYSAPASFTIENSQLVLSGNGNQTKTYDAAAQSLVPNLVVTGNGVALTKDTDDDLTAGEYRIEYFNAVSATQPAADAEGWGSTEPSVINVSESGLYWYRVSALNYTTKYASVTVTINKAPLTVSAADTLSLTKVYDRDNQAVKKVDDQPSAIKSWTVSVSGGVGSQVTEATVTGVYTGGSNVASNTNITVTYTLTAGDGFLPGNYTLNGSAIAVSGTSYTLTDSTSYAGQGSITAKPITVTGVTAADRAYNGSADIALSGTPATDGILSGDTVSLALKSGAKGTVSDKNAAAAPKDVTIATDQIVMSGASKNNYTISSVAGTTVTISKRAVTIALGTSGTPLTAPYTGFQVAEDKYKVAALALAQSQTGDTGLTAELNGLKTTNISYQFYSDSGLSTPITAPTNYGTYYLKATWTDSSNFTASTATASNTFQITTAELHVDTTAWNKVYDGSAHAPASFAVTGVSDTALTVGSDYTVTYLKASTLTAAQQAYTNASDIATLTGWTASADLTNVADSGKYFVHIHAENYVEYYSYVTATVKPVRLVIEETGLVKEKTYDGNTTAAITGGTVTAASSYTIPAGETIAVSSAAAAYNSKDAATANSITVTYTMSFTDADAGNYTYTAGTSANKKFTGTPATASETITGTAVKINKKDLTVTGVTAVSRVYDGTLTVSLDNTGAALTGIVGTEAVSLSASKPVSGTLTTADASDSPKAVAVSWNLYSIEGADSANYKLSGMNAVTVTISKADPTITEAADRVTGYSGNAAEGKYYYVTVTGNDSSHSLLAKDNNSLITYEFKKGTEAYSAAVPSAVGAYTVKATYAGDTNHSTGSKEYSLTIEKAYFDASSSVTAYTGTYDGSAHAVVSAASIKSQLKVEGVNKDITGTTSIYVALKTDGETSAPAAGSDRWKLAFRNGSGVTTDVSIKNAGSAAYWVKLTEADHTDSVMGSAITASVAKRDLVLSSTVTTEKVYDGKTAAAVTAQNISGVQTGDDITLATTAAYGSKTVNNEKTITVTYTLTYTTGSPDNYNVKDNDHTISGSGNVRTYSISNCKITAKALDITGVTATSRAYDGTALISLAGTPTATLCQNDSNADDTVTIAFVSSPKGTAKTSGGEDASAPGTYDVTVGTNQITLTGTDASNYTVGTVNKPSVTISKKQLELKYGGKTSTNGTGEQGSLTAVAFTGSQIPSSAYASAQVLNAVSGTAAETTSYSFWKDAACAATPAVGTDSSVAPTAEGTYYVKATLAGNTYYEGAVMTAKLQITAASLTVTASAYTGTYDGITHSVASALSVKGVVGGVSGTELNASDYKVFYMKAETRPEADNSGWTQNLTVKNVADSGKYWYKITADNFTDAIGAVTGNVAITAKSLTFSVSGIADSKTYDGTTSVVISGASVTPSGTIAGETITAAVTAAAYNNKNVSSADKITETISVTFGAGALAGNYSYGGTGTFTSWTNIQQNITASISAKALTVTIKNQSGSFTGSEPWTGGTQNSADDAYWTVPAGTIQTGDTKASLNVVLTKEAGTGAGTYHITGAYTNTNYAVTFQGEGSAQTYAIYTITANGLIIKIADAADYYGEDPADLLLASLLTDGADNSSMYGTGESIATIRGLVGEDAGKIHIRTAATASSDVKAGGYEIYIVDDNGQKVTTGNYGDYTITFQSGTYTVNKRPITITAKNLSKKYDAEVDTSICSAAPASAYTVAFTGDAGKSALVNSDTVSVNLAAGTLTGSIITESLTRTSPVKTGGYAIVPTVASLTHSSNYEVTLVNGTYTVNKADLSMKYALEGDIHSIGFDGTFTNTVVLTNESSGREMNSTNGNAFGGTITYSSEDTSVATVNAATGEVTPVSSGSTKIKATIVSVSDPNYNIPASKTAEYIVAIAPAGSILANVTVANGPETFSSAADRTSFTAQPLVTMYTASYPSSGVSFTFSTDGGATWSSEVPEATAPGDYPVVVKASKEGFADFQTSLTAHIYALTENVIYFVGNGGTVSGTGSTTVKTGFYLKAEDFPEASCAGRTLTGWALAGGDTHTAAEWGAADAAVTSSMTFVAQWEIESSGGLTIAVIEEQTYTGGELKPAVSVTCGGDEVDSSNYIVTYSNNVNVAAAESFNAPEVSVVGTGGIYLGLHGSRKFSIVPKSLGEGTAYGLNIAVADVDPQEYTGSPVEPLVTVRDGSRTLECDQDYTVVYGSNVAEGEANITITGCGNYTGVITKTFTIVYTGVTGFSVVPVTSGYIFTGDEIKPVTAVYGNGRLLAENTDYVRSFTGNINATGDEPTASVTITGLGEFADFDPVTINFAIGARSILNCGASLSEVSFTYDAAAKQPLVTVTSGAITLVEGQDYTIAYENNVSVGTAKVTVTAQGNYTGTKTLFFEITAGSGHMEGTAGELTVDVVRPEMIQVSFEGTPLEEGSDYTLTITVPGVDDALDRNVLNSVGVYLITAIGKSGTAYAGKTGTAYYVNDSGLTDTTGVYDIVFDPDNETSSSFSINISNNVKIFTYNGGDLMDLLLTYLQVNEVTVVNGTDFASGYITVELEEGPFYYIDGHLVEPDVSVYAGKSGLHSGTRLNENDDYTVYFGNNNGVGTASYTVSGAGCYTGTISGTFEITASSGAIITTSTGAIRMPDSFSLRRSFAALGAVPAVTPYISRVEKNENGVYRAVSAIDEVGTYLITIDMDGTPVEMILAIAPKNISAADSIALAGEAFTYGGYAHEPKVTITDTYQELNGGELVTRTRTLTEGTDYTVVYTDNVEIGTASATITGIGNYTGQLVKSFKITDKKPGSSVISTGGSSAAPEYKVTLVAPGNMGTLIASADTAAAGDTVIVIAALAKGYGLKGITVTDANKKAVALTKVDDTSYRFIMPACSVTVTAEFASVFTLNYMDCHQDSACVLSGFPDVDPLMWYHDGIHFCVENRIMLGYANGNFGPDDMLTRAQFITMLYNMSGRPVSAKSSSFTDVETGLWYSLPIAWAEDAGIISGYGSGAVFGPNDLISREQMVQIMYNYAVYCGKDVTAGAGTDLSVYGDAGQMSSWAKGAMQWACGSGIISGRTNGKLGVKDGTTRAEAATVFLKYVLSSEKSSDRFVFVETNR